MIKDFVLKYTAELKKAMDGIPLGKFEKIINIILDAYKGGHSIYIMGNGGSASAASHFACDVNKGVSSSLKKRFRVICLNDNIPIMLAYANDKSYKDIFVEQLKNFLKPKDVVVGISASGNSKNVIKALKCANKNAAISVAFTGFNGGQIAKIAKISLIVPANDMQKIEDAHLILMHMIMKILCKRLKR